MKTTETWFADRYDELFYVKVLEKECAIKFVERLVTIHNDIPFQRWEPKDFLAENDASRQFIGKWEISRIAFAQSGAPIGFCIGFELQPDHTYYHLPGIYLHRLAVAQDCRSRFVGALVQAETIAGAFDRGLKVVSSNAASELRIYGQANDTPTNVQMIRFYQDSGFRIIGRKPYPDREDLILVMSPEDFDRSRHAELRRSRLCTGESSRGGH